MALSNFGAHGTGLVPRPGDTQAEQSDLSMPTSSVSHCLQLYCIRFGTLWHNGCTP
jgi:hypothetical protein